jgi:hypothetical protein
MQGIYESMPKIPPSGVVVALFCVGYALVKRFVKSVL